MPLHPLGAIVLPTGALPLRPALAAALAQGTIDALDLHITTSPHQPQGVVAGACVRQAGAWHALHRHLSPAALSPSRMPFPDDHPWALFPCRAGVVQNVWEPGFGSAAYSLRLLVVAEGIWVGWDEHERRLRPITTHIARRSKAYAAPPGQPTPGPSIGPAWGPLSATFLLPVGQESAHTRISAARLLGRLYSRWRAMVGREGTVHADLPFGPPDAPMLDAAFAHHARMQAHEAAIAALPPL